MGATDDINLWGVTAAIDTNVLLEICSIHDLHREYEKIGGENVDAPELVFRRARARDSLLLAMHLHSSRAKTIALPEEFKRVLTQLVPPDSTDDFRWHFTSLAGAFLLRKVLHCWKMGTVAGSDEGLEGRECDDRLVQIALRNQLPLITNEGLTMSGLADVKLRKKAVAAGVAVFTPGQFWKGKLIEEEAIKFFFARFDKAAPNHVRAHPSPNVIAESLDVLRAALRHVLLGETKDQRQLARVVLAG